MDEPLDARLELDEGPVVGETHHLAADPHAHAIALFYRGPWIGMKLLVAQGDPFCLAVELEHHYVDFVVDLEELRRMCGPPP